MPMAIFQFNSPIRLSVLLVALCWNGWAAADWQQYQARYAVYRNGNLVGKADISFELQGERLVIRSDSNGTHGMARILGASDNEYVEGRFSQGQFRPEHYTHHTRVAGIDDKWTADYDWSSNIVKITKDEETLPLDLGPGALDGLSLKLELRRRLRDREPDLTFFLVDDEKIKQHVYQVLRTEQLETSLGCLQTVPVERVRTGSTRFTRAWHAPALDFITVRMEHGKTDGDHVEMRITELVVGHREVKPQPGCAAVQTSQARP